LHWYSGSLLRHGEQLMAIASRVFAQHTTRGRSRSTAPPSHTLPPQHHHHMPLLPSLPSQQQQQQQGSTHEGGAAAGGIHRTATTPGGRHRSAAVGGGDDQPVDLHTRVPHWQPLAAGAVGVTGAVTDRVMITILNRNS